MTEQTGFPEGIGEPDLDAREADEVIDNDVVFGDDAVDEELDRSWSPPERPLALDDYGTTLSEQRAGETLDQRLAREEPDPTMAVEPLDVDGGPAAAGDGPDLADLSADPRSGRLVAPDQGLGPDEEKDLIASDVGIDAGAAGAEEAAMHVVGEDIAVDEGSTR